MKLAIITGNRDLVATNINTLKKVLKTDKKFVVPIKLVCLDAFSNEEYRDFVTNNIIHSSEYKDYMVIVDGQHRAKAWVESGLSQSSIPSVDVTQEAVGSGLNLIDYIAILNSGKAWTKQDHINAKSKAGNPVVKLMNSLTNTWAITAVRHMFTVFGRKSNLDFENQIKHGNTQGLNIKAPSMILATIDKMGVKEHRGKIYYPEFIQKQVAEIKKMKVKKSDFEVLEHVLSIMELFDPIAVKIIDQKKGKKQVMDAIAAEYQRIVSVLNTSK